ncbi:hypothetical protein PYK79_57695, partial [Streptomyces sp. ID05-04B]|uniref:hypothetical protein n=1 Tax=Streptomyces sp. ID05-04B TaxID=3028661 RepID=UPI0029C5545A
ALIRRQNDPIPTYTTAHRPPPGTPAPGGGRWAVVYVGIGSFCRRIRARLSVLVGGTGAA